MSERYKTLFNYGSIGGLAAFVWMLAIYWAGFSPFGLAMITGIWIPALVVFLSIKANSKTTLAQVQGFPFSRAFFDGITTSILAGLLKGMLAFVFMKTFASDLPEQYYLEQEKLIAFFESQPINDNDSINQLKMALEQDEKVGFGGYRVVVGEINKYFYMAVPFSIIAAFIYKKPLVNNDKQN